MSADVRPSTVEPIWSPILVDSSGVRLSALTDVYVRIVRADGLFYDWIDSTFKAFASVVQVDQLMAAVSATGAAGLYLATWTPPAAGIYLPIVHQTPGTDAHNLPATIELRVGQVAFPGDAMDLVADAVDAGAVAASAVAELQAGIATAAAVAALPTAADVWAVATRTLTAIGGSGIASQASVSALPSPPSAASIASAVWSAIASPSSFTFLEAVRRIYQRLENRLEVDTTGSGRELLYDDDGTTVIATSTLRDGAGGAITTPTGSPARRGAST